MMKQCQIEGLRDFRRTFNQNLLRVLRKIPCFYPSAFYFISPKLQHLQMSSENEMRELKARCQEQDQQLSDQQHQLKINNRQMQDLAGKHRTQMEKLEKQMIGAQREVQRLRGELEEERSMRKDANRVTDYNVLSGKQRLPSDGGFNAKKDCGGGGGGGGKRIADYESLVSGGGKNTPGGGKKRKKVMFNPRQDRLSPSP